MLTALTCGVRASASLSSAKIGELSSGEVTHIHTGQGGLPSTDSPHSGPALCSPQRNCTAHHCPPQRATTLPLHGAARPLHGTAQPPYHDVAHAAQHSAAPDVAALQRQQEVEVFEAKVVHAANMDCPPTLWP